MKSAKELYDTQRGKLAFVIGTGPSLKSAKRWLSEPQDNVIRIAVNQAIESILAEYWMWIDLDAYQRWKGHPYAREAKKIGVEHFKESYEEDVYVWDRAKKNIKRDMEDGALVHRATSIVAACSLAWRLGAYRICLVGCENRIDPAYLERKKAQDPSKNWESIYTFTFARIAEAMRMRKMWLPKNVMLVDASRDGTEDGDLPLPKTSITYELSMVRQFHDWLKSQKRGA